MVAVNVIARQSQGELAPALEAPEGPTELSPKNARYLAAFWENITINSDYTEAHRQLGLSLRGMRRFPDTIARIYYNLGCALEDRGEHAAAIDAFRKAIESKPDYADAHYNLGCNLLEIDQPALAEPAFRRAIDIKSDYVKAHHNLGWCLIKIDRFPAAVAALRQAIKIKPDYALAYSHLGMALYLAGRLKISIVVLRKALEINPDDMGRSHYWLVKALTETRQFDEALAVHSRLMDIPGSPDLHLNRADIFLSARRFDEALSFLDSPLVALRADDARVHLLRGRALLGLNRPGDALVAFYNAVQRGDDSEELKAMLDHASASCGGLLDSPIELLELAGRILENPEDSGRLIEEISQKHNIGAANNVEAEKANGRAENLSQPTDVSSQKDGPAVWLQESAHDLYLANRFDAAITAADHSITLDENLAPAHIVRAAALNKIGRHEEAIEACNRAHAINRNYSFAHAIQADALFQLHREEEALAPAIQAITIDPEYVFGHEVLGCVYYKLGRYAEGMSAFAAANRLGGNASTYAYHAAARMAFLSSLLPGPDAKAPSADIDEIIADCDRSIELWSEDNWLAHYIRSQALLEASRFDAAIDDADRIIKMRPNIAFQHGFRGRILVAARRFNEAIESFDRALEIDPEDEDSIRGRRDALEKAQALKPANNDTLANQINQEYDNTPENTGILSGPTDADLSGATLGDFSSQIKRLVEKVPETEQPRILQTVRLAVAEALGTENPSTVTLENRRERYVAALAAYSENPSDDNARTLRSSFVNVRATQKLLGEPKEPRHKLVSKAWSQLTPSVAQPRPPGSAPVGRPRASDTRPTPR